MCNRKTFGRLAFAWQAATVVALFVLTAVFGAAPAAQAQSFQVIHYFTGQGDGAAPAAGLTVDGAGKFYGTTIGTGESDVGSVFKLTFVGGSWTLAPLYNFQQGEGGAEPDGPAIIGPNGNLFGVTYLGGHGDCLGNGSCGVVYELQPPPRACSGFPCFWTPTVRYQFNNLPDAGGPFGSVVFDSAGNLYGTTEFGGDGVCLNPLQVNVGCGTVYQLTPSGGGWTETIIYNFQGGNDGNLPSGGPIFDAAGNLYGTTYYGGDSNCGTIFELSPSGGGWTKTILHNFQCSDGSNPAGNLIADQSGNLYGAAENGGASNGGVVFELSQPGSWTYNLLYSFPNQSIAQGPLLLDGSGNLYGTTSFGGSGNSGTAYKLTPSNGSWTETDLHDFLFSDGIHPNGGLVFDSAGNLYGTAEEGGEGVRVCGQYGCGTIWKITP